MTSTIRFLRPNRYRREIGSLDTAMGYGVHQALVHRGIAEFVHETPVVTIAEPTEIEPHRERKPRRYYPKES